VRLYQTIRFSAYYFSNQSLFAMYFPKPLLVIALFTLCCTLGVSAQNAIISFKPVTSDEREIVQDLAENNTVSLYVDILGRSHLEAFLYGVWGMGPGPLRSVLLRTRDGGKTWREVMTPVGSSQVWEMQFLNAKTGFALVLFTMEGPGEVQLFRTLDGGATWTRRAAIPKSDHSDVPVRMYFTSAQQGEVYLSCNPGADAEYLMRQNTTNGGMTWKKGPCQLADTFTLPQHSNHPTKDLTMWELKKTEHGAHITILRYRATEQQKPPVARLHRVWKVVGKHLYPAE